MYTISKEKELEECPELMLTNFLEIRFHDYSVKCVLRMRILSGGPNRKGVP